MHIRRLSIDSIEKQVPIEIESADITIHKVAYTMLPNRLRYGRVTSIWVIGIE